MGEKTNWPDPTHEMLDGDPLFEAIWQRLKTWDVNVPEVYNGYMGATGNHARAIYDAVLPFLRLGLWARELQGACEFAVRSQAEHESAEHMRARLIEIKQRCAQALSKLPEGV